MPERNNLVTFKSNPVTLVGNEVAVGAAAPNVTLTGVDLKDVSIDSYKGKVVVLSVVPSLDTPVCQVQTKHFNQQATALGDGVAILTISVDLPFAQKRWCGAEDAKNVVTLSEYKDHAFGNAYGLRIKELGLLARAVLVLDKNGVVQYSEIVPEIAQEPNYDAAMAAVKKLL